jgi:hypothetical protein
MVNRSRLDLCERNGRKQPFSYSILFAQCERGVYSIEGPEMPILTEKAIEKQSLSYSMLFAQYGTECDSPYSSTTWSSLAAWRSAISHCGGGFDD